MFGNGRDPVYLKTLFVFEEYDISSDVTSVEPDTPLPTPLPTDATNHWRYDWKLPIESVGEAKLIHTT